MMNWVLRIFNYRFYVKEFLLIFFCYLFSEGIFSWLFIPNSGVVNSYEKILGFIVFGVLLYSFRKLKLSEKAYVVIFSVLILRLMFESLFVFNSLFQQPTMFYVLAPVLYALFIKFLCRQYDLDLLEFIAKFYLITYLVFMVIYGRGFSFSLESVEMEDYGPFSGDSRIIHASRILMMVIPLLWYLNKFIATKKNNLLIPIFFCLIVILIHQHRSVWSCSIVSLMMYFFISTRANRKNIPKVINVLFGTVIICFIAYFFISNMFPGFIDFMADRFSEIFDPAKEDSTGQFRVQQRDVYSKLFLERPIFGWTFEGFEMKNPLVDWWPEKTGQHFHEGYMEMLFYHGLVGFFFKFSLLFYVTYRSFSKKLTEKSIIMVSFCVPGLLFSFNYVLPLMYWGHVGLCLYYLEKDSLGIADKTNQLITQES